MLVLQVSVYSLLFGFTLAADSVNLMKSYNNPIIPGFAPDPSCIRVDDRFFCVSSSFGAFPGMPVYTSKDLIQWEQIGNVLSRPSQLPDFTQSNSTTGGIWAATIRHHRGMFYVTTTLVLDQLNFTDLARWENVRSAHPYALFHTQSIQLVFKTDNPFGNNWSDPVHFQFRGYDTSLFWDDDDRVYVVGSHYWRIFPAIQAYEISLDNGTNLSPGGVNFTLWSGTGGMVNFTFV